MTDNGEKNLADSFAADSFVNYEAAEQTNSAADGDRVTCPACDAGDSQTDATGAAVDRAAADGTTDSAADGSDAGFHSGAQATGTAGETSQTGKAGIMQNKGTAAGSTIAGAEIYRSGSKYSNGLGIAAVISAALKLTILPFFPGLGIFAIIASSVQASRKRAFDWWSAIGLGLGIASVLVTIAMIITFIVLAANAIAAGGVI